MNLFKGSELRYAENLKVKRYESFFQISGDTLCHKSLDLSNDGVVSRQKILEKS